MMTPLILAAALLAQDDLRAIADAARATAEEMRFNRIPWLTDPFEAFRLAKQEKRPVFLYVVTGDPLDDC
jgi:hypothetical protein